MNKFEDRLTILIPTYNRKARLFNTLNSLSMQGHWGEYEMVIVDNCSDYSVSDMIHESFSEEFTNHITVHRWFFNTGMSTNISIAFEFVNTKWCWFLSDDDEIIPGSIEIVLRDCKVHSNASAIKYSIQGICSYNDKKLHSVHEVLQYYMDNHSGDKGYLAMLYNIEALYPFLGELTIHSYSYLSFWIPVLMGLNEYGNYVFMSSSELYRYKENNDGWSSSPERYLNTLLGIRTLFDYTYGFSNKDYLDFKHLFSFDLFNSKRVVKLILLLSGRRRRKHYYSLLKSYFSGKLIDRLICSVVFNIAYYFNLAPTTIERIINRKKA